LVNKILLKMDEFEISWDDLQKLPEDHVAAFSVLSYAVSEVNALAAIYIGQSHKKVDLKHIDSALNISRFMVLRSWSSKFFEARQFIGGLCGNKPDTRDAILQGLAVDAIASFDSLSARNGYHVAGNIRNEAASHYSFSAAKKNLSHLNKNGDFNFYVHEHGGNCFYPIGEEVMFQGRLNRRWSNIPSKQERDELLLEWLDWNLEAQDWLNDIHATFARELIFNGLGRQDFKPRADWLESALVGNLAENLQPRFTRKVPAQ
jgi:hypothetical protein